MEDLIDIEGLDAISMWPLAVGWWLTLFVLLIIISVSLYYIRRRYKYRMSWQYKSYARLCVIREQLNNQDHKQVLQGLSMELRKIAMLSTKREACAGLIGTEWLQWLQDHDPTGFKWVEQAQILIDAQYMPKHQIDDSAMVKKLIQSAQAWVEKC